MSVGPCGLVCMICRYYVRGLCQGCVRGDLCPPEKAMLSPCPVLRCAAARKTPYCSRDCADFPCALFERGFPRCWPQTASRRPGVTLLGEWEPAGPPVPATTSDNERARREGLRVFCLGPFHVYRGSEEIQDDDWGQGKGPTHKIKAMFAYLLSRKKRGARKETLIDLLWPEQTDSERASASFHLALHCLRRALEPDLKPGAASSYIRYEKRRYRFDPLKPCWIDADAFEAHCRRALRRTQDEALRPAQDEALRPAQDEALRRAQDEALRRAQDEAQECDRYGDPESALLYWGLALDVYGGDYMAGIDVDYTRNRIHDWCMPRRHRLRELYLAGVLEMARCHRNVGEYGLGVKYAREALDVEPAFEPAHRIAMQCLFEAGQPDSAIHQYRMCEAELAQHENRAPSEQTRLLYEQLIRET